MIRKYKITPFNSIFTVYKISFGVIEKANVSLKDKQSGYSVPKHAEEQGWDIAVNGPMFSNGKKGVDPYYYWNLADLIVKGKLNRGGNYSDKGIAFGNPFEGVSAYQSTTSNSNGKPVDFIGGAPTLILDDKINMDMKGLTSSFANQLTQRTAIGIDKANIFILVTKGNKATLKMVAEELLKQGCTTAINLDGGGSTAIVADLNYTQGRNVPSAFGIKLKSDARPSKNWIQDAGHGGSDPGAISNGNVEKDYNLEAALHVNGRLKEHGIDSTCTRTEDIALSNNERTNMVKQYKNCISHHFNAGGGSGTETIHSIHSSPDFANMVIDELRDANYPVRPKAVYSKENSKGQDWYYMHRDTGSCKTTIIEHEFVDGPQTAQIKDSMYRQEMYECTVKAICRYEGVAYKPLKKAETQEQSDKLHRVQVGAFANIENAERLKDELKSKGYAAFVKSE